MSFSAALAGNCAAAQTPKKSADSTGEKPAVKYQIDFRLQVSPDLDKQRVVIWINLLRELGASGVSQVAGAPALPKESEQGAAAIQPAGPGRLVVQGSLGPSGNLFIGTDGFRMADRARLAALIKNLQVEGMPSPDPAAPMWGLGQTQVDLLQRELKQPSRFELSDRPYEPWINELRGRTKLQIKVSPEAQEFGRGLKLSATSSDLSLGSAVAYVLGQHGLAWEPRLGAGGSVTIQIMLRWESKRPWPVGLSPEQFAGNLAPQLMGKARFQTNNMPLDEVLAVFRRELKMDVLLDRASLIEHDINPDKLRSTIQIPGGTFHAAIRKTIGPMGLKHELRIDESNRPFLWLTWGEPTGLVPKKKQ